MPKILIVDDDDAITELIKTVVSLEGYESTIVNDSTRAVEAANLTNPDVIVLDIMMPNLSGLELCTLLHKDPKFANTPILFITAKIDAESKRKAALAGAKGFLTKPFRIDDLIDTLKDVIA